jgi:hypothetical protein
MEASLRRLTHELELYKQGMSALMSLKPFTDQDVDAATQRMERFTVHSFLLKHTHEPRTSQELVEDPLTHSSERKQRHSHSHSHSETGRASRPVSRQSDAAPARSIFTAGSTSRPASPSEFANNHHETSQTVTKLNLPGRSRKSSRSSSRPGTPVLGSHLLHSLNGVNQVNDTPSMVKGLGPRVSPRVMLVKGEGAGNLPSESKPPNVRLMEDSASDQESASFGRPPNGRIS